MREKSPGLGAGKIGRNDPCRCGSGKKYKKCCLAGDESLQRQEREAHFENEPSGETREPKLEMNPYVLAKTLDDPEIVRTLPPKERSFARRKWSPKKVAVLSNEEITKRLAALGVDASPEKFKELAAGRFSAWTVSEVWLDTPGLKPDSEDNDFMGLAACELWKRYCPETPSMEMLDDWMQEGYMKESAGKGLLRCLDLWMRVWERLRPRFTPETKTLSDVDEIFPGTQSVSNWVQDVSTAFLNTAGHREYIVRGIALIKEVLERFPDESRSMRHFLHSDLAELHFLSGDEKEGERICRELIRESPRSAVGYVGLANGWSLRRRGDDRPVDLGRAIAILEEALAVPVSDAGDWDVKARLSDLRKKQ